MPRHEITKKTACFWFSNNQLFIRFLFSRVIFWILTGIRLPHNSPEWLGSCGNIHDGVCGVCLLSGRSAQLHTMQTNTSLRVWCKWKFGTRCEQAQTGENLPKMMEINFSPGYIFVSHGIYVAAARREAAVMPCGYSSYCYGEIDFDGKRFHGLRNRGSQQLGKCDKCEHRCK